MINYKNCWNFWNSMSKKFLIIFMKKSSMHEGDELTLCSEFDDYRIRSITIRDRTIVIPEVGWYWLTKSYRADYPLRCILFLYVKWRIVRREIKLTTSETPYNWFRSWHRYRCAFHLFVEKANTNKIIITIITQSQIPSVSTKALRFFDKRISFLFERPNFSPNSCTYRKISITWIRPEIMHFSPFQRVQYQIE